ncbi:MAG: hypothetical protein R3E97_16705 [Candidatus Eisenbacteria bacterium]
MRLGVRVRQGDLGTLQRFEFAHGHSERGSLFRQLGFQFLARRDTGRTEDARRRFVERPGPDADVAELPELLARPRRPCVERFVERAVQVRATEFRPIDRERVPEFRRDVPIFRRESLRPHRFELRLRLRELSLELLGLFLLGQEPFRIRLQGEGTEPLAQLFDFLTVAREGDGLLEADSRLTQLLLRVRPRGLGVLERFPVRFVQTREPLLEIVECRVVLGRRSAGKEEERLENLVRLADGRGQPVVVVARAEPFLQDLRPLLFERFDLLVEELPPFVHPGEFVRRGVRELSEFMAELGQPSFDLGLAPECDGELGLRLFERDPELTWGVQLFGRRCLREFGTRLLEMTTKTSSRRDGLSVQGRCGFCVPLSASRASRPFGFSGFGFRRDVVDFFGPLNRPRARNVTAATARPRPIALGSAQLRP